MESPRQLAQLRKRSLQIRNAALDRRRRRRLRARASEPQRQRQAHEALLGAVVEVALDPAASLIGGRDDARARLLELDPGVDVGDRLRDKLGERAEASLRVLGERLRRGARCDRAPQMAVNEDRRGDPGAHAELAAAAPHTRPPYLRRSPPARARASRRPVPPPCSGPPRSPPPGKAAAPGRAPLGDDGGTPGPS